MSRVNGEQDGEGRTNEQLGLSNMPTAALTTSLLVSMVSAPFCPSDISKQCPYISLSCLPPSRVFSSLRDYHTQSSFYSFLSVTESFKRMDSFSMLQSDGPAFGPHWLMSVPIDFVNDI